MHTLTEQQIAACVDQIYMSILQNPSIHGNPLILESYILGIERLLNEMLGDRRVASYSNYLFSEEFGSRTFSLQFQIFEHCQLGFVPIDDDKIYHEQLTSKYASEFRSHWTDFIDWRSRLARKYSDDD